MGRVGSAHDNAFAESFVATLKTELLYTATVGQPERPSRQRSSNIWWAFTTHQVNTPLNNTDQPVLAEEIEVTDPKHPLFGRRFPILSAHDSSCSAGHVLVSYRDYMALRIELRATSLTPSPRPKLPAIKLISQAVRELAQLAEQCEVLCAEPPQGRLEGTPSGSTGSSHSGEVGDPYGGDR